jgi:hypothetical protein
MQTYPHSQKAQPLPLTLMTWQVGTIGFTFSSLAGLQGVLPIIAFFDLHSA